MDDRIKVRICGLPFLLTPQDMEDTIVEMRATLLTRARIQNRPEEFDFAKHSEFFTKDEIKNLSQSLRG